MEDNNFQMLFPSASKTSMANLSSAYPVSSNNMIMRSQGGFGTHDDHHNKRIVSQKHDRVAMGNNGTDDHEMIKKLDYRSDLQEGRHEISAELISKNSSGDTIINNSVKINKKGGKKIRKPKYAFQTRSQVDILDDGYRWRKYGQKAVKNNKFPRSYYRCTHEGCNVKKQVQRLTKDEGVVVTTYEGMHSHPIEKHSDNFEHILNQMQIYTPF